MPPIEFTQNYQDLSTDVGFQFKFMCERCGDGFMSTFDRNVLGTAGGLLRSASGFLGDIFGKAADSAYEVQRAVGGASHDAALKGRPSGFRVPIREVRASMGAGFLYPLLGEMRTMPGLPSEPNTWKIDIDDDGNVVGLF